MKFKITIQKGSVAERIFNFFRQEKQVFKDAVTSGELDVYKQLMQEHADKDYERNAKAEGADMFQQYLNKKLILVPRPRQCFHMIYTKSKWESGDYDKIKQQEFKRLKSEYEFISNTGVRKNTRC